jgi:hypothetical protein
MCSDERHLSREKTMNLTITKKQAEAIEAAVTEQEAPLWLEMVAFLATPPDQRGPRNYNRAKEFGISAAREQQLLDAAGKIVRG